MSACRAVGERFSAFYLQAKRRSRQRAQRLTFSGIARARTGIIVHVFFSFLILSIQILTHHSPNPCLQYAHFARLSTPGYMQP